MPYKDPHKDKENKKAYYRKNSSRLKAYQAGWKSNNQDKVRSYSITGRKFKRYKITKEQYDTMLHSQKNQCAICKIDFDLSTKKTTPHVDHCHETGRIRGLLCHGCNVMLGCAKDKSKILQAGIKYLANT